MAREDIKLSLFIDDRITYVHNKKNQQKTPGTSNIQSKVAGYKVNMQKSNIDDVKTARNCETVFAKDTSDKLLPK